MGGIIGYFFPGNLDEPDPATGLTPRQKSAVRQSWDIVAKDMKGGGLVFYIRMFEENPDYQNLFPKGISSKSLEELKLPTSIRMRAQAVKVMMAVDSYVKNLDDPEVLVTMLKDLANTHYKINVVEEHFKNVKSPFMFALATALGSGFDTFTKSAWGSTLDVIEAVVCQEIDAIRKNKDYDDQRQ